jgi:hypothetical protein
MPAMVTAGSVPKQGVQWPEQSQMLDEQQNDRSQYQTGRQCDVRRDVIQDHSMTGEERDDSHRQYPKARTQRAVFFHRFDSWITMVVMNRST